MDNHEISLYEAENGQIKLYVQLAEETVWLTLNQMTQLFERDKSVISRHLKNIFETNELDKNATVAKYATVQSEGGRKVERDVIYYNLDVIISLGYRINSKKGIQFRKWASQILKEHLIRGYTVNEKRISEKGVLELQQDLILPSRFAEKFNFLTIRLVRE